MAVTKLFARAAACCTVFLTPVAAGSPAAAGTFEVLHRFQGGDKGFSPAHGMVIGEGGSLFGVTEGGCGTAFRLSPPKRGERTWQFKTIWVFSPEQGCRPSGRLTVGGDTIYGAVSRDGPLGGGMVFRLVPDLTMPTGYRLTIVRNFEGPGPGVNGDLVRTPDGTLYGTARNPGHIFRLTSGRNPDRPWTLRNLRKFSDEHDPEVGPVMSPDGSLYGPQSGGYGVAYRLSPPPVDTGNWKLSYIYRFGDNTDGWNP